MAELEHWKSWRARCALARCTGETARDLQGFAHNRFCRYLRQYAPQLAQSPPATEAWHQFESYLALGQQRAAKAGKEWLFARGTAELDAVQGGATLIMRDVVRDYLRHEHAPTWMSALHAPVTFQGDPFTLCELLPDCSADPLAPLEMQEHTHLAASMARQAFEALNVRERIALIASHAGLSLAHPTVTDAAKCRKSTLFNCLHSALRSLSLCIRNAYPNETPESGLAIALALCDELYQHILDWISLEKPYARLFLLVKEVGENG